MGKRVKRRFSTPWLVISGLTLFAAALTAVLTLLLQGKNIAVLNPMGSVASAQKDLLIFTLILSAVIVIPVFIMIAVFAWRYRDTNTKRTAKYTPDDDSNKWLEAIWWGIPIVIITILSVVTWISTHQLDPYKPLVSDEKPIKIQVVSMQWKWLFIYPEYNVASINVVKMPVGVPVNFEITGDAPMSAFWIPNLGTQTYAMNGMSAKVSLIAEKDGRYRGSNTNISGEGYADMEFYAETLPNRKAFEKWASMVRAESNHNHMDMTAYEKLARPSRDNPPQYLHLHDGDIYAKVMSKYMHHGGQVKSEGDTHSGH
jgi:cytochrome o ubiquinol oxidase subunit 2